MEIEENCVSDSGPSGPASPVMTQPKIFRNTSDEEPWMAELGSIPNMKRPSRATSIKDLRLRMAEVQEDPFSVDRPRSPSPFHEPARISWNSGTDTTPNASDSNDRRARIRYRSLSMRSRNLRSVASSLKSMSSNDLPRNSRSRQLPPRTPRMSARLSDSCWHAIHVLDRLQVPAFRRFTWTEDPVMPKTALRFSESLVFSIQKKAAFGIGIIWGNSFILHRIGDVWSAPLFLKEIAFSAGISVGGRIVEKLIAMPNKSGIHSFLQNEIRTALDLGLALGMDPFEADAPLVVSSTDFLSRDKPKHERPKEYTLSDGMIVDASWRFGKLKVDKKTNHEIYGADVSVEHILNGVVQAPPEFDPLYEILNLLTETAQVVKQTKHKFELARQDTRNSSLSSKQVLANTIARLNFKSSHGPGDTQTIGRQSTLDSQASCRLFGTGEELLDLDLDSPDDNEQT